MNKGRAFWLIGCFVVFSLTSYLAIINVYQAQLVENFQRELRAPIENSLSESLFRSSANTGIDDKAIYTIINAFDRDLLAYLVQTQWAPVKVQGIYLRSVDSVISNNKSDNEDIPYSTKRFTINVLKNDQTRPIVFEVGFGLVLEWLLAWITISFVLVIGVAQLVPKPLMGVQHSIYNSFRERKYNHSDALHFAKLVSSEDTYSPENWKLFDFLLEEKIGFETIAPLIKQVNAATMDFSMSWFKLAFKFHRASAEGNADLLQQSFVVATAPDQVIADSRSDDRLQIHGLPVKITSGPLSYYIFYLQHRLKGEGWVTNPKSGKPNKIYSAEISDIIDRYGGDARTKDNIETGIDSKMLASMRSNIGKAFKSPIDSSDDESMELIHSYLFESKQSEINLGRNDFRVVLKADQIILYD